MPLYLCLLSHVLLTTHSVRRTKLGVLVAFCGHLLSNDCHDKLTCECVSNILITNLGYNNIHHAIMFNGILFNIAINAIIAKKNNLKNHIFDRSMIVGKKINKGITS